MRKRYRFISILAFCAILALTVAISGLTTLYGDDFFYGTFCLDGVANFFKLNYEHYVNFNGRAFVHSVLELLLAFRDSLFFIIIPALIFGAYGMFYKAFLKEQERGSLIIFFVLAVSGTLCLSVYTLREGMLWMSGAMNYIFPLIFTFSAYLVTDKAVNSDKLHFGYYILAFFAGATTEQAGAMSLVLSAMYLLHYGINNKKCPGKRAFAVFAVIFLGYLSVYLSPATLSRLFGEAVNNKLSLYDRYENLMEISFGKNASVWPFVVCELMMLFEIFKKKKAFAAGGAVVLIASVLMTHFTEPVVFGSVIILLMLATALVMLFSGIEEKLSMALFSAGAAMLMLLFSTSFGPRNMMPVYIVVIAILSALIVKNTIDKPLISHGVLPFVAVIITAIFFSPTLSGYVSNRVIINNNIKATKDSEVRYNMDIKYPYSYVQFFELSLYEDGFKRIYGIDSEKDIFLTGKNCSDLIIDGKLLMPVFTVDGEMYYPMRDFLEANGWELFYDNQTIKTTIKSGDREVIYDNREVTFEFDGRVIDARRFRLFDEEYGAYFKTHTYFSWDIFEEVFEIYLKK